MSGHRHLVGVGLLAQVAFQEHVAQLHRTAEVEVGKAHLHLLLLIAGIVHREGTLRAVALLEVLHQHMTAVHESSHVGLLVERVLVQGNELLVRQQGERRRPDGPHVTAYEQG